MNKNFKVNYLSRDFSSIKTDLVAYAERYYSDKLADLSEASLNSFLIESVAYVGDILSYYLDYQTNETFLTNALEVKNVNALAKAMGYKTREISSASGKVAVYLSLPEKNGKPDFSKAITIKKGSEFVTFDDRVYITTEDVKIDESSIGENYVVTKTNNVGNPVSYGVKSYLPIISGRILTTNIEVGNFIKFRKLFLGDLNTAEIISIHDNDGNEYYQVSNLTQNIVYKAVYNSDVEPKYILKPVSAIRRFVFDYDSTFPYLLFGAKQYKPDEDLSIDPVAEPTKFILNRYNNDYLTDEVFDPNLLLNGDSYGIGPDNTVLTIKYRSNVNSLNNADIGEINKIKNLLYSFDNDQFLSNSEINQIVNSIQIANEEQILGQTKEVSINEIKDLAGQIFSAQSRAVTAKDYETLTYMMPQKYGSIKRVSAVRDPTSLKNNINLFIICDDKYGYLTKSNIKIKENLKTWLSSYKVITDSVDIIDAKIINLGIDFTIRADPYANKAEVLEMVQKQLEYLFSFKPQIGQSFSVLDIYREIRKVENVLDVVNLNIINKNNKNYSSLYFNVKDNTTSDGNLIKIPKNAIYEIKYPQKDIRGSVI